MLLVLIASVNLGNTCWSSDFGLLRITSALDLRFPFVLGIAYFPPTTIVSILLVLESHGYTLQ
jgi:hypothetical protein